MPNVNLTDSRKRDAVVKAESTAIAEEVRYLDGAGHDASPRKVLKATVDHDYDTLFKTYDQNNEKLGAALVDGDPEVDIERCGVYLWGVSKVYVNSVDGVVYRIEQTEIVRDPDGNVKEERPRRRAEANVDMEIPLTWSGKKIAKAEAVRRFLFSSKLQIVHINGLTYDFLYGMAKELSDANSLMMIGAGKNGRDPLVFRNGSVPYRGFLEGRVKGDNYILLLHLSNMELKSPESGNESRDTAASSEGSSDVSEVKKATGETVDSGAKDNSKTQDASEKKKVSSGKEKRKRRKPKLVASKSTDELSEKQVAGKKQPGERVQKKSVPEKNGPEKNGAEPVEGKKAQTIDVGNEDLGVWLKSIRMGKYLDLFVRNEIDIDVLPELTDDDLKELDVPLGSRRRLLKALSQTENLRAEIEMAVNTLKSGEPVNKKKASSGKAKKSKKETAKSKKKKKSKSTR